MSTKLLSLNTYKQKFSFASIALSLILVVLLLIPSTSTISAEDQKTAAIKEATFESNTILIKLKEQPAKTLRENIQKTPEKVINLKESDSSNVGLGDLQTRTKKGNLSSIKPVFPVEDGEISKWFLVTLDKEKRNITEDSIEGKDLTSEINSIKESELIENAVPNNIAHLAYSPNDDHVVNNYQYSVSKLQAKLAWDITKGSSSVKVAVVDSGISSHNDISGSKIVGAVDLSGSGNTNDANNHGTGVAGIIAANINNSIGPAGISPNVSLLNVKVVDDSGGSTDAKMTSGVVWAVNNGAKVINISLAIFPGITPCNSSTFELWRDAIHYAVVNDVVVVAAAGNTNYSAPEIPASCDNVISVASTDANDAKASTSNYGTAIDIAAPGVGISTTHGSASTGYAILNGTSFAAPHVSAVAALVRSANTSLNATASGALVTGNADAISGTGTYWSNGRVNADKAVWAAISHPTPSPIYRLVANGTNVHFFTASLTEKNYLVGTNSWTYEGVSWKAYTTQELGTIPVYRLVSSNASYHYWTSSSSEITYLTNNGWTNEGVAWYAYPADATHPTTIPIYQLATGVNHFYTVSTSEVTYLTNNGWTLLGVQENAFAP